jgi:aryl-alcohol dehydrogenase-like predicted oxidoreductase
MVYGRLMTTRQLGHTDIYISPIGLGTAQFAGASKPHHAQDSAGVLKVQL